MSTKLNKIVLAFVAAACLVLAGSANATVVSLADNPGSSAPTLNSSFGTFEAAVNFGDTSGGTVTAYGFTFANNGVEQGSNVGPNSLTYGTFGANNITISAETPMTAPNFDPRIENAGPTIATGTVYQTESFPQSNDPITLTLEGLNPNLAYHIQVMSGETRSLGNGIEYVGDVTVTTDTDGDIFTDYAFGDEGSPAGNSYNVLTLVVSGTDSVDIEYGETSLERGGSYGGIVIQSAALEVVPEPSSFILGGFAILGLIGLAYRRRRRNG